MGWMPLSPTASRCAKLVMLKSQQDERASMKEVAIVGVDLAKNVCQLAARRRAGWFWSDQEFLLWAAAMLADGSGLWRSPREGRRRTAPLAATEGPR